MCAKNLSVYIIISIMVLVITTTNAQAETATVLNSVETSGEFNEWSSNGTITWSTEHVTEGSHSLKIEFSDISPEITFLTSATDISAYRKIKFDIYVEGQPLIFTAKLRDSSYNDYRSWYYLYDVGYHVVEYAIPGMATQDDPTHSCRLKLYAEDTLTGSQFTRVYIDNLRVTAGEDDDNWLADEGTAHPLIEVQGNIMQNGDFELGLLKWNSWGTWDGGSYIFGTGRDDNANSGNFSASIVCKTVGRGGYMSARRLVLEPGQYEFRYWVKGTESDCRMFHNFEGSDSWLLSPRTSGQFNTGTTWNEKVYTIDVSEHAEVTLYLYSVGPGTIYIDAISLARLDGVYEEEEHDPMTPRHITIDGENILVDGKPFFMVGMYNAPPNELVGTGFNFTTGAPAATDLEAFDQCEQYGIMTWGSLNGVARGHTPSRADDAIMPLKDHPAVLCWYNVDEPDHNRWNVPPPEVRYMTQVIHEVDPHHVTCEVNMPWADSNTYQYVDTVDIPMIDPYADANTVLDQVTTLREAAGPDKPMWVVLKGFDQPNSDYLYGTTYGSLVRGANGLLWFSWNSVGSHAPTWNTLKDIALELKTLSGALTSQHATRQVATSSPLVEYTTRKYGGKLYIICLNHSDYANNNIEITVNDITDPQATVLFESRNETLTGGNTITDDFAPWERHVYVLDILPGDYNSDDIVDQADYTIWADTYGTSAAGLPADGNGDQTIDQADYTIWADHFGQQDNPPAAPPSGNSNDNDQQYQTVSRELTNTPQIVESNNATPTSAELIPGETCTITQTSSNSLALNARPYSIPTFTATIKLAWARVYATNDADLSVGSSVADAHNHIKPLAYRDNITIELGTLGGKEGEALDVNNLSQIVGWVTNADGQHRAVIFDDDGNPVDLNTQLPRDSNWVLLEACSINDDGQIIGIGILNGQHANFVLNLR